MSLFDPSYNAGIVVSYFLGSHLTLVDQAKIQLILPTIFLFAQFVLEESPEYYAKRNNEKVRHIERIEMISGEFYEIFSL